MRSSPKRFNPPVFSEKKVRRRILLVAMGACLFFAVIVGRAFILHLMDNAKLSKLAESQYQKKITLVSKRGNIYDSKGEELAIDVKVDSVYVNPKQVSDTKEFAKKISSLLNVDSEKLQKDLEKDKRFVWIKRRMSPEESQKIQNFHHEALGIVKECKRFYPNKNLAATILGAVGFDSVALGGLELFYDKELRSAAEPVVVSQDARGQSYLPLSFVELENPNNVVLTLDKTIQFITEKELNVALEKTQAKSAIALVMDVHTGEVLAMASVPDFDPNQYFSTDLQNWKNRVVSDNFEPGSIFKAITAAAALESGKVNLQQKFNCEGGSYHIDKFTIKDHGAGYGMMALPDIIRVSSNIGSLKVAQYVGKEFFSKTVQGFGFGSKTGIDVPGEVSGIIGSPKKWSTLQMSTIAFGQGIGVTPIQVVTAYSAIANGGNLMKPYIVKKIVDSKGVVLKQTEPQVLRRVMKEENAKILRELLKLVVGPGGTGTAAQVEEYGTAGKTGTAQKVSEGKKGYAEGKYIGSFAGIAPADDPKIAVLVSINEPKGQHFGGVIAAPVFRDIVRQTLPYLGVAPKNDSMPVMMTKADEPKEAKKNPETKSTHPLKEKKENKKEKTAVSTAPDFPQDLVEVDSGSYRLPSCKGKMLRELLREWRRPEFEIVVEGSGVCVGQSPAAGEVVRRGEKVKLIFKAPVAQ
ncbi:MAG: penicillin-binding protein [Deltaproteobacteria bacterium]|nr:penicillin-binding protein [Deltaproteobacteria bacterium]